MTKMALNPRHVASALLVSAVLTLAACGADPHDGSTTGHPTRPADPESAWQAYYAATHPDPAAHGSRAGSDLESAWQAYYAATHPDPAAHGSRAGSDPESAWQAYYAATHPDPAAHGS